MVESFKHNAGLLQTINKHINQPSILGNGGGGNLFQDMDYADSNDCKVYIGDTIDIPFDTLIPVMFVLPGISDESSGLQTGLLESLFALYSDYEFEDVDSMAYYVWSSLSGILQAKNILWDYESTEFKNSIELCLREFIAFVEEWEIRGFTMMGWKGGLTATFTNLRYVETEYAG
jgi:hypothetical protein